MFNRGLCCSAVKVRVQSKALVKLPRTANWILNQLMRYEAFRVRKPTEAELEIILESFNERAKRLAFKELRDLKLGLLKILKLWSALRRLASCDTRMLICQSVVARDLTGLCVAMILSSCRLWQNCPHTSNAPGLQTLKNAMYANADRMRSSQKEEIQAGLTTLCCTFV